MAGIKANKKPSPANQAGARYKRKKYNRGEYTHHKLGKWNKFQKNRNLIVSVLYDLPGPQKGEPVNCVFDSSHWADRIDMVRSATPYMAEIDPMAICLPADYIGYPGWDNNPIPDNNMPEKSVISKIKSSQTYKDLVSAWRGSSASLIFGYGFLNDKGDPIKNQLVCVTNRNNDFFAVRKNSNTVHDWPRRTKINNKKFAIAVCFDLQSVEWENAYKNSILVNPRHISTIGIKKDNESAIKAAKRTGSASSGRLAAGMNRRIDAHGFTYIFCPVFRFKSRTPNDWDPMSSGFTWSAKKSISPHTHYKPIASLLIERADKRERAFFNIFMV